MTVILQVLKLFKNLCSGDLSDLLSGDAEVSDEDSLSDLVAANMAEDDENEFVIDSSVLQEVNEGSAVTIFSRVSLKFQNIHTFIRQCVAGFDWGYRRVKCGFFFVR